jgi:hypothetical protein
MGIDGDQDAIHAGSVLEGAHRVGSSTDFSEASLDGIGAHRAAVGFGFITEAGDRLVEVVAKTGDSARTAVLEALSKVMSAERAAWAMAAFTALCKPV